MINIFSHFSNVLCDLLTCEPLKTVSILICCDLNRYVVDAQRRLFLWTDHNINKGECIEFLFYIVFMLYLIHCFYAIFKLLNRSTMNIDSYNPFLAKKIHLTVKEKLKLVVVSTMYFYCWNILSFIVHIFGTIYIQRVLDLAVI